MNASIGQFSNYLLKAAAVLLAAFLLSAVPARATVISGTISGQADFDTYVVTDGTHSADFLWSERAPGSSAWIYATFNTYVAVTTDITNVAQITNAGSYTFETTPFNASGWVPDAAANGGTGGFAILQSTEGYYAVVRIDDVRTNDTVNATWWFQTDGTGDFSSFIAPEVDPLAEALNATNLTWATGGDADWFVETNETHDAVSAAQSGLIGNNQTNWVETTVSANGELTFYWKVSSEEDADYLTFYINGIDQDTISGDVDWQQQSYSVQAGDTVRWEYSKNGSGSDREDSAWLDEVHFAAELPPVTASFNLVLVREENFIFGYHDFYFIPEITSISPIPITTNYVESADGNINGEVWAGNSTWNVGSSSDYSTIEDAIAACTNGAWTLYINRGDASEQQFHFNVSVSGLNSSVLAAVNLLVPMVNATDVATNSPLHWSGPAGFSSLFVSVYQLPSFNSVAITNMPGGATNWPSPPTLPYGTNGITLSFSTNFPGITFSTPVDTNSNPILSWTAQAELQSQGEFPFVVAAPAPLPALLSGASNSPAGNFQFSFQTQPGHTHIIQARPNLVAGDWFDVTNFVGDGSAYQFTVPATNSPGAFFRLITQ